VELQTSQMPAPHTWADMGSAVASVDLYCPVEVAGLAALLRPAEEGVELDDLRRLVEEAGRLGFQRSAEEAGLAGFAMAAENWTLQSPRCLPKGVLD
jgi:hypothetical protein